MWVVGTAGHVDHGKSTLVEALTGTNPDRLKEEKQREMTIELGFASMKLPDGETVGIVDVPGHRDFIENMLAGVGGIDAVLFVVAADEGVMPQTREHLAILDLLQVKTGIIVLTKADLITDAEWFELVEQELREFCKGTILQNAPLVRVSAVTGQGIGELKQVLASVLAETPEKRDLGKPRLPVDRVFSIVGYGTVVTGTLIDGSFTVGEEVQVLPADIRGRIRGIQAHNRKMTISAPGSRTALNLSGVDREEVQRGDVIVRPSEYKTTTRLDAKIRLVRDSDAELKHNDEIKFFIGSAEVGGRVRLLGKSQFSPAEEGFAQIELHRPVVAVAGDRFILRRPSPPATIGGGTVLDPQPGRRHRLNDPSVLQKLDQLAQSKPTEALLNAIERSGICTIAELKQSARMNESDVEKSLSELLNAGEVLLISNEGFAPETRLVARATYETLRRKALSTLEMYHQENPTRTGMPREELKNRLGLRSADFSHFLQIWLNEKSVEQTGQWVKLPAHQVSFNEIQQKKIKELLAKFGQSPFSPPSYDESVAIAGELLVSALIETGRLVRVNNEVLFTPEAIKEMRKFVFQLGQKQVPFTVAEFRDHFQTSRKYALAYLEYLDAAGITRREGEGRIVLRSELLESDN